ncbi:MAG: SEL1-like repeat protein [Planctomycetes bacterium]|nr:SEL1-like repeat protein [Planctomycetota bacterium]
MQIGRYEIVEELGRGGMGAVYRGRDPETGQEVAIKVLLRGRGASPHQRTRFDREARALTKVEHPNVVRLLGVGEERGAPFLVMAYCRGGSLEEALKRSLPSPDLVVSLGVQLAAGLAAAHAQGVLHRDLKPENVLLGADGSALLTDFGLAKDLSREGETQALTQSGTIQGTPGFWAPEQAQGKLDAVGPRTDVYGLGAILYAALCGRPPIVGESLIAIMAATVSERPAPLRSLRPEVPAALEAVVMRCLEKDPGARWGSVSELGRALAVCLEGAEGPARSAWVVGLASAGIVGVVTLLGGALLLAGQWGATAPEPTPGPSASQTASASADLLFERALADRRAKRFRESAALYRRAANLGHSGAMHNLGVMLEKGLGVAKDEAEAVKWYRRAAEKGHRQAMYVVGVLLEQGRGVVDQDDGQAVKWFRRAAEKGHPRAMDNLGVLLAKGRGVTPDEAQAAEWFRRAAERGDTSAMSNLGVLLEKGQGVTQDEAEAVKWYRRAAEKGEAKAMFSLGVMLDYGRGVGLDEAQATKWYRRAAEKGDSQAMFSLGLALGSGRGVDQDEAQAVEWYRRAAEKGKPEAMFNLGVAFMRGEGVGQDEAQAVKWYRRAAEEGEVSATFALGLMLESGRGVAQDEAEAAKWYRRAAEKGDASAMHNLGALLVSGRGVTLDLPQGVEWYRRAAEKSYPPAMFNLAIMLERGRGVGQDKAQAVQWYQRAARGQDANIRASAQAALDRLGRSRRLPR